LSEKENESFTAREGYNALINNSELDINSKFDLINISTAKNYSTEEREYFNDSIKNGFSDLSLKIHWTIMFILIQ